LSALIFAGIFGTGFVFGYLLYYAVRHTKEFNIDLLSSAVGAVGGATVIGLVGRIDGWIGPYGLGLASGFLFYLVLSLILIFNGKFKVIADNKVMLVSRTLLGSPRQE
jgi:hypothetical protein